MDPALQELIIETHEPEEELEAVMRLVRPGEFPDLIRVVSEFDDVITCRIRRKDIFEVYASPKKFSLKAARYFGLELGISQVTDSIPPVGTTKTSTTFTKSQHPVVIGIIDWGCDFTHPNFRNDDGTTRLLALWDQSMTAKAGVQPYGYGKVFYQEEINRALNTKTPFGALNYHPAKADSTGLGAHGTHVMDIAAGNGRVGKAGIAPGAKLIFVHLSAGDTSGLGNLGDSVRILEAIDFVRRTAGSLPLVINLSVGRHGGPHDGETLVEMAIDNFLLGRTNTMLCQSTGNYYKSDTHACGRIKSGKGTRLTFFEDKNDTTQNELEIWYSGRDEFDFKLSHDSIKVEVPLGTSKDIIFDGKLVGRAYHRKLDPLNNKNHINVFLYRNAPKGYWNVELSGIVVVDGRFHAWIERDTGCRNCQAKFISSCVSTLRTTGTICNGFNSLAVGAYNSHSGKFEFGDFSSQGPTVDGRTKPDLIAPGVKIRAARSAHKNQHHSIGELTVMSGTSMAAPHVTGTVARILEFLPAATPFNVIRNIINGSTAQSEAGKKMPYRYGNGILDTGKAIRFAELYARASGVKI